MRGAAAVLLMLCSPLAAQTTLGVGALRGTVLDASDLPAAGAKVTLIEASKGLVRESKCGSDGSFFFQAVLVGIYSVRVEMQGFRIEQMNDLRIEVGQEASVNIRLEVGEIRTSVTVPAPALTELNAQSNTIGSLVDSARVRELPLNGRNFLDWPPFLRQTVKTQLIMFCIEWRIESWDLAGSLRKSSSWQPSGGWSKGFQSARPLGRWKSIQTCCTVGGASSERGPVMRFRAMESSVGRRAASRNWNERSVSRPWKSIF